MSRTLVRVECVEYVERRVADDASKRKWPQLEEDCRKRKILPSIWLVRTDFSSSFCIRPIVRRSDSVTLSFAVMSASSLFEIAPMSLKNENCGNCRRLTRFSRLTLVSVEQQTKRVIPLSGTEFESR